MCICVCVHLCERESNRVRIGMKACVQSCVLAHARVYVCVRENKIEEMWAKLLRVERHRNGHPGLNPKP